LALRFAWGFSVIETPVPTKNVVVKHIAISAREPASGMEI